MTAIAKALTILELTGQRDATTMSDFISATGLPRSTIVRIVGELLSRQFLERVDRGRYRSGPTIRSLARNGPDDDDLMAAAHTCLDELASETGETTHFAVYEPGYAVYVDKVDGLHPIRAYTKIGGRSPAYATATGKALLAWQQISEIERVAAHSTAFTRTTRVGDAVVIEERRVRNAGYAINRGEWREGVWGIAAPAFDANGVAFAAIGISGPQKRIKCEHASFARLIVDKALRISRSPAMAPQRRA